jgi:hypothetical protein
MELETVNVMVYTLSCLKPETGIPVTLIDVFELA